jgi:type I restriction enzyme R subunit
MTEADTCRRFVLPKLDAAGWSQDQICEQRSITDGRIVVSGGRCLRRRPKRADYILCYGRNLAIAVVEAKAEYKHAGDGLQQAKDYAEMLGVDFAYATNGMKIIEHDYITGKETVLTAFPSPNELWSRWSRSQGISSEMTERLLQPCSLLPDKKPRYYQEIAINRAIQSLLKGKKRILLTLATGTGKTFISYQIIWKLWNTQWNRTGEHRRPRVLYLADRNVLIDDPKDKMFAPFGDARHKIQGEAVKSREIYFSTYQAIAEDESRRGLYKEYPSDFFDLIIVDECHRGSAKDESNWRTILEYFEPAFQLGMTATPRRKDNTDTYKYFGNPVYTYSLKQGIEDGFLAPYQVHRIVTNLDAIGYRPVKGEVDAHGNEVPDRIYGTKDFERTLSVTQRTNAIAKNLTDYLKRTDRFGKTIVFCVDQEHADQMRMVLNNLNVDLVKQYPDYVCRVTAEEGDIGRGHLDKFMEIESKTPVILTTSQLLTTGIDAPMCRNIVICKVIESIVDFKQIIGRGTRVRSDYGKEFFTILDYTGAATRKFADPEFDGEPALLTVEEVDLNGDPLHDAKVDKPEEALPPNTPDKPFGSFSGDKESKLHKFYVDGGSVEIAADMVQELDPDGKRLRVIEYSEYARNKVRSMFTSAAELRSKWNKPAERKEILDTLADKGITFETLAEITHQNDADPFDLLCHVAYNMPLRTRRERAESVRVLKHEFFERFQSDARDILNELLDKYIDYGTEQLTNLEILKVPPISRHGNIMEISKLFGGPDELRSSLAELQNLIYSS